MRRGMGGDVWLLNDAECCQTAVCLLILGGGGRLLSVSFASWLTFHVDDGEGWGWVGWVGTGGRWGLEGGDSPIQ